MSVNRYIELIKNILYLRQIKRLFYRGIDYLFMWRNIRLPIKQHKVNVFYWRPYNLFHDNVGDILSPVIVSNVLQYYHIDNNYKLNETRFISAIGSCIHYAKANYVIWGSGFTEEYFANWIKDKILDIRCVRGPKTLNILTQYGYDTKNISLGDPAILLPLFFKPEGIKKEYKYGIVPYFRKTMHYKRFFQNVIPTLTHNWKKFILEILKCDVIISSSLHGIILSESYGIPTIMLNDHNEKSNFKFDDYYLILDVQIINVPGQ